MTTTSFQISSMFASRRGVLRSFHSHTRIYLSWSGNINDPVSPHHHEEQKKTWKSKKHATIAIYTLLTFIPCFHSFPASSAPSWWYYLSFFLLHRRDEGCIKLAAWQGERVRGQHRGPCFKKKKVSTLSASAQPPMSPSHNTESDIESGGLLFKIAAHRHSSEDLNNQLWKEEKRRVQSVKLLTEIQLFSTSSCCPEFLQPEINYGLSLY